LNGPAARLKPRPDTNLMAVPLRNPLKQVLLTTGFKTRVLAAAGDSAAVKTGSLNGATARLKPRPDANPDQRALSGNQY